MFVCVRGGGGGGGARIAAVVDGRRRGRDKSERDVWGRKETRTRGEEEEKKQEEKGILMDRRGDGGDLGEERGVKEGRVLADWWDEEIGECHVN